MSTNQMLLVIVGLVLLSILILLFFEGTNAHISSSLNNEAVIVGSSIGMSLLEEITIRKFDENITDGTITPVDSLTASGDFGPETGEDSVYKYNDIDDFHNHSRSDTLSTLGIFDVLVKVNYINTANPNTAITAKSYHKRIEITVGNGYLKNPFYLYHVVSY